MAGSLTAVSARNAPAGRHHDGNGLWLYVKPSGARSWVLRVTRDGRRQEIGVGSYPAVQLAQARQDAARVRAEVLSGADPVAERRAVKAGRMSANERTFERVAELVHGQRDFGSARLSERWIGRLRRFAFPHFGAMPIDKVDGPTVLSAIATLWREKPETARRVRQLVSTVLDYAHAMGWRDRSPDLAKLTRQAFPAQRGAVHHAAVDYLAAPDVVARLHAGAPAIGRLALLFTIYTAARSGETRFATWGEIDLEGRLWRVPGPRMKMRRDHAVPLSPPALRILEQVAPHRLSGQPNDLVFPGERAGRPLSDMTLAKAQKLAAPATTVHGWRSTFRDWAGETTPFASDVIEAALAHQIGNATTRAYQRGDFLLKRRDLMDAWAQYCHGGPASTVAT